MAPRLRSWHAPLSPPCFPPEIIQYAIWLYLRFTLSYRDVEELLAERRLDISYETVRRWVLKFGPSIARRLRGHRPRPSDRWHLDEMVVRIAGVRMYLWRAIDHEGEVLDTLVQRRRDSRAALRLMRKLLKRQRFAPKLLVTDKLRTCASAFRQLGLTCPHEQGLRQLPGAAATFARDFSISDRADEPCRTDRRSMLAVTKNRLACCSPPMACRKGSYGLVTPTKTRSRQPPRP
jgi:transposase-like protein